MLVLRLDVNYTPYLSNVKYCGMIVSLTRLRGDVYLCYDPISSGFIGILTDRPMIILVEVHLNV